MTTARQALPTMTAMMRTTMMAMTLLAMKVPGLGLITVLRLMTPGTKMETTATAVIKGNKDRLFNFRAGILFGCILPALSQYSISNAIPFAARSSSG